MTRIGLVVGVVSVLGCDDGSGGGTEPHISIHVDALSLPLDGLDFELALRLVGPTGEVVLEQAIPSSHYGNGHSLSYISTCDASDDGINRVELGLRDLDVASAEVSDGVVLPAQAQFGMACEENGDVRVDYTFELTTKQVVDDVTTVRFADMACEVSRACTAESAGLQVVCKSAAGPSALGVRDVHIACGAFRESLAAIGPSDIRVGGRAEARATSLPGLELDGNA